MSRKTLQGLSRIVLTLAVALSASVVWGQGQSQGQGSCTIAGTWYGGSDAAKYLGHILPGAGSDFSTVFDGAFSLGALGFPVKTVFAGSILKTQGAFEFYAIGMVNDSTSFPAPAPQVYAVHATVRVIDCSTLRFDYDFFGAYLWSSNRIPFVDPPDYVVSPPPFSETYRRMPTDCPQCGKP